jgi:hypothetical protein
MAVRERAPDVEGFGCGDEDLEMGEVTEGLVGDGLALADGATGRWVT